MIEMVKMTEFVDDDVVDQMWWEEEKLVVKIEIPFLGAATPARLMVFNKYFAQRVFVEGIKVRQSRMHEHACLLFII